MGNGKTLILGSVVVAATVAAMLLLRKDEGEVGGAGGAAAGAEAEPLEIAPLVPHGRITEASWATSARTPDDEPDSALDLVTEHDRDREQEVRANASLEETVRPIEGLGVYIAPAEETKAPGKGR